MNNITLIKQNERERFNRNFSEVYPPRMPRSLSRKLSEMTLPSPYS